MLIYTEIKINGEITTNTTFIISLFIFTIIIYTLLMKGKRRLYPYDQLSRLRVYSWGMQYGF